MPDYLNCFRKTKKENWFEKIKAIKTREDEKKVCEGINKAKINLTSTDEQGNTLLHVAAQRGFYSIFDALMDKANGKNPIDVNARNNEGHTPLHLAAIKDTQEREKIVERLIRNNAQVEIKSNEGETALDFASNFVDSKIKKMLSETQFDPRYNVNMPRQAV